ncbi:replicative DNA helicase, partial [Candidatus Shapirobacteria bacterium CG10_big_fil_rev_8_21_14_0_10_38_8]
MAKVPPHNNDAEEGVLGAVLIDRNALTLIADSLKPEHFYDPQKGLIYQAVLDLFQKREPIDIVTLADQLTKSKNLRRVGGSAALAQLAEKVPTSAHVQSYSKLIKDTFIKREMVRMSSSLNELAFDESTTLEQILDRFEQEVFSLSQQNLEKGFVHVKKALADSFDRLDELHKSDGKMRGVPTGLAPLDHMLSGLQPSNLLILAARPGTGKTAFSLGIAQHCAVKEKMPVGFFSLEMSKEELIDRLLVAQADIDAWKLKTGRLGEEEYARLSDAMGVLAESPIFIDDTPAMSILEMRTKARRLASEYGLKLIIMDYLTLARASRPMESRVQEVGE